MATDGRIGVLHVISGLGLGGAERMLLWSARHHDRDQFRMGVVSIMSGGELAGNIREEGVDVFELGQTRGSLSWQALKMLSQIIRSFEPRIVQGHMYHSNLLVRMLVRFAGIPGRKAAVLSTRHIDAAPLFRRIVNGVTGFLNSGTLVFSQRVFEEEKKENFFKKPLKLVPYGIEIPDRYGMEREDVGGLRVEFGIPSGAFLWMAAGRLTRQKGFPFLIDAFSRIAGAGADPCLIIIGDGEDMESLVEQIRNAGLEERVLLGGSRTGMEGLYSQADAFVLSSIWEGGPLVILEAMAAGLPVVSTRVGDAPAMVVEGETGILVDPEDAGQLADAMGRVQGMGPEAGAWGEKGRRRVEELYDFRRTQREVEAFYRELLIDRESPGGPFA